MINLFSKLRLSNTCDIDGKLIREPWKSLPKYLLLFVGLLVLIRFIPPSIPGGVDFRETFFAGATALLKGENPYLYIYNPPWVLIPFFPLTLFTEEAARILWVLLTMGMLVVTMRRFGAGKLALIFFLLSPPVFNTLLHGNIEWLVMLGFTLPSAVGLFFIVLKPQMSIAVAFFWLIEAYRDGGIKQTLKVFLPVSIAFVLSFVVFGFWPLRFNEMLIHAQTVNFSIFPYSIPIGVILAYFSIKKRDIRYAMLASPLLSPYTLPYAWIGFFAALHKNPKLMAILCIGSWAYVLIPVLM